MPRVCTVCTHEKREEIDQILVKGTASERVIASQFGLSQAAVNRHVQAGHVEARIAQASEAREIASADNLLNDVRSLRAKAIQLLIRAEQAGDLRTAIAGVREVRGVLELLGKLVGELADAPQVAIFTSPAWIEVRQVVLEVLGPHPELKADLAARLRALEGSDG